MNRDYNYGTPTGRMNQLQHLRDAGLMTVPEGVNLTLVEKHPRWNVATDADVQARVRAYLEVNCMHCHTQDGAASNSNLFLDSFRKVDREYGICKKPVAAGKGTCEDCLYDIVPGDSIKSILRFRVSSAVPGIRMPPLARSLVHGEAANLIASWIDETLQDASKTEGEEACTGQFAGTPLQGAGQ